MKQLSFARKEKIVNLLGARFFNNKNKVASFLGFLVKSKWNEIADTSMSDDEVLSYVNSLKITFGEYLACEPLCNVHLIHSDIEHVGNHCGTSYGHINRSWERSVG